jgi:hypothetical protein
MPMVFLLPVLRAPTPVQQCLLGQHKQRSKQSTLVSQASFSICLAQLLSAVT